MCLHGIVWQLESPKPEQEDSLLPVTDANGKTTRVVSPAEVTGTFAQGCCRTLPMHGLQLLGHEGDLCVWVSDLVTLI